MDTDRVKRAEQLCRAYAKAMGREDLDAILANFTDDAIVVSPLSGPQPVREFYRYVLRVTSGRKMALRSVFVATPDPRRAAIHAAYTRQVGAAEAATIEVVDLFELTEDGRKFSKATIIYDTAPVRPDFEQPEVKDA